MKQFVLAVYVPHTCRLLRRDRPTVHGINHGGRHTVLNPAETKALPREGHRLLRVYSPQSTVLLQRWYQNILHQAEFQFDCAATLQLKMPLPNHSPRACLVALQSGASSGIAEYRETHDQMTDQMTEH